MPKCKDCTLQFRIASTQAKGRYEAIQEERQGDTCLRITPTCKYYELQNVLSNQKGSGCSLWRLRSGGEASGGPVGPPSLYMGPYRPPGPYLHLGKINIFQPLSEASQHPPARGYLRVNSASIAALGAEAKKEAPAQLVVAQELSWSGRQDSNMRPSDPQSDALPG